MNTDIKKQKKLTPRGTLTITLSACTATIYAIFKIPAAAATSITCIILITAALPYLTKKKHYTATIQPEKQQTQTGDSIPIKIRVNNPTNKQISKTRINLQVNKHQIQYTLPTLKPGATNQTTLHTGPLPRGITQIGPITHTRKDPLTLIQQHEHWGTNTTIHVHPRTLQLTQQPRGNTNNLTGKPNKQNTQTNLNPDTVRQYTQGDPLRHIHWPTTAKLGKPAVKQFETTQQTTTTLIIDTHNKAYKNQNEFELALSIASSIALNKHQTTIIYATTPKTGKTTKHNIHTQKTSVNTPHQTLKLFVTIQNTQHPLPTQKLRHHTRQNKTQTQNKIILVTGSTTNYPQLQKTALNITPHNNITIIRADEHAEPRTHKTKHYTITTIGTLQHLQQTEHQC